MRIRFTDHAITRFVARIRPDLSLRAARALLERNRAWAPRRQKTHGIRALRRSRVDAPSLAASFICSEEQGGFVALTCVPIANRAADGVLWDDWATSELEESRRRLAECAAILASDTAPPQTVAAPPASAPVVVLTKKQRREARNKEQRAANRARNEQQRVAAQAKRCEGHVRHIEEQAKSISALTTALKVALEYVRRNAVTDAEADETLQRVAEALTADQRRWLRGALNSSATASQPPPRPAAGA